MARPDGGGTGSVVVPMSGRGSGGVGTGVLGMKTSDRGLLGSGCGWGSGGGGGSLGTAMGSIIVGRAGGALSMTIFMLITIAIAATWPPMISSMVDGDDRRAANFWRPAA
jgi:hypothetical protein